MVSKPFLRSLSPESPGWNTAPPNQAAEDIPSPAAPPVERLREPSQLDLLPSEKRDRRGAGRPRRRTLSFEHRIRIFCCLLFAPGFLLSLLLLWKANTAWAVIAGTLGFLALISLILLGALLDQIVRPLQTLANVVASLREGDYSFRARGSERGDALGELAVEVNLLADLLQDQRLSEMEATALLRNVVRSMDAPVLAFDRADTLRLINPAGERLLDLTAERALGRSVSDLHLGEIVEQPDQGVLMLAGRRGRWMVRRSSFRQRGVPLTLLILADVSVALREQEREAWQRLIRVLGHEINNSLTPIKSIAGTLRSRAQTKDLAGSPDFDRALKIIENRADSLNRFIQAYRQLAQLPQPVLRKAPLRPLLERVAALETRVRVQLEPGPGLVLSMDPDQMEQMMINLIRNAAEASLAPSPERDSSRSFPRAQPEVKVSWKADGEFVEIMVTDNGPGLMNLSNLFVPFYTTKTGGSGVGLALARQICEAHGGSIQLANRPDGPGCQAHIRFPYRA